MPPLRHRPDTTGSGPAPDRQSRLVSLNRAPHDFGLSIAARRLELSRLPEGILTRLYAYWRSKGGEGRLPGRADIDPMDFPWALGRVCLLEVSQDPLVFRYRLDGSLIAEHRRRDMTGRTTDELCSLALANVLRAQYGRVAKSGEPNHFEVHCARDMASATISMLALPLSSDGALVDMLLVCGLGSEAALAFY